LTTAPLELELPRDVDAPQIGRRSIEQWFAASLDSVELDTAKLLVTELVTNALTHGHGTITLRAHLNQDRLLVEVMDEGTGFERAVRDTEFERVGGWGLAFVDSESSRWGVHEGSTHVWFELERAGPRLGREKKPPLRPQS
jgi:anti-sigma regulatory factor (Ser/Thr protein kinase)